MQFGADVFGLGWCRGGSFVTFGFAMIKGYLGGNLGERLLRNRGRLRFASAAFLQSQYSRLYASLKRGRWSPEAPLAVSDIPISLTSWSRRFDTLHFTLLSLIKQNVRPREIVLWISADERSQLPPELERVFKPFGVRIEFCDDLRSHKKWLPFIESGEQCPFVICDDDIFYPPGWFGALVSEDRPDAYVGVKCHRIVWQSDGHPAAYSKWHKQISWTGRADMDTFITGCGGAIIHPDRITSWFRNRSKIAACCPLADDVWLKAAHMAVGVPCYKSRFCFPCLEVGGSGESGLAQENVSNGRNDEQVRNVSMSLGMKANRE